jgi:hypothetical protein
MKQKLPRVHSKASCWRNFAYSALESCILAAKIKSLNAMASNALKSLAVIGAGQMGGKIN